MTQHRSFDFEIRRLEALWAGEFGDAYNERNLDAGERRDIFWKGILRKYSVGRVLEVGCNVGANLRWICEGVSPHEIYGVDINWSALKRLRDSLPMVNAILSAARDLPFRDKWFDLVFTAGVLIHQSADALPVVMAEIVRCSRRYVLCVEYFAEEPVEVLYRGQERALFKRNYGRIYQEMFPDLKLVESEELSREQGWDDVRYWWFEKKNQKFD